MVIYLRKSSASGDVVPWPQPSCGDPYEGLRLFTQLHPLTKNNSRRTAPTIADKALLPIYWGQYDEREEFF